MSEQPTIHRLRLARQVSVEVIADSGPDLLEELVSELVSNAREELDRRGLTIVDLKISLSPYEPTMDEFMRRQPSALAGQFVLVLVARGMVRLDEKVSA